MGGHSGGQRGGLHGTKVKVKTLREDLGGSGSQNRGDPNKPAPASRPGRCTGERSKCCMSQLLHLGLREAGVLV